MDLTAFDPATAERVIEQLRFGVPPPEHVRAFTVGRADQLHVLEESLAHPRDDRGAALLVKANYGAGKSHLLKVVREMALDARYVVSLVVIDAHGGIRFNRMDTILGAICRELEVPGRCDKGLGTLFDAFAEVSPARVPTAMRSVRKRISSDGRWGLSDYLQSAALYVALRAWIHTDDQDVRDLVSDWFANPFEYRGQRKRLWRQLVANMQSDFLDPRPEWHFYDEQVFAFHTGGHRQAWAALADLQVLARAAGLRGVVVLFDEFEDVIQNLPRRDLQQQAFLNLFRFFDGDRFPGMSYFAVTPDFVAKCKSELLTRGIYSFDYKRFDLLPSFEMESIEHRHFQQLAAYIRSVYAVAYGAEPNVLPSDADMARLVDDLWAVRSPDRVRRAIQGLVSALDEHVDPV